MKVRQKRAMEISNFLHRVWNVEIPENRISTNQIFLMNIMSIAINAVYAPFSSSF